ncbi:hypothetical protein [Amycolatopsis sp. cg9]|uniref:hypothetical protein n=1 Tax=Amycolatopsis sp. cg9 TaxID=3238801 RepID=UPI0035260E79
MKRLVLWLRSGGWRRAEPAPPRPDEHPGQDLARPIVHVVDARNPNRAGVPEGGLIYGYARPTPWGFLVVQTGWLGEAVRRAEQVGPIEIRYNDRSTGAPTSRRIRAIVACPHGQWQWLDTGWAIDDPGQLAPAHHLEPPTPELLYDVRWHWGPDNFGMNYRAEMPHWKLLAWCATEDWATRIAEAAMAWDDERLLAAQVQRPGPSGRELVLTYVPEPHRTRPQRSYAPASDARDWPPSTPPTAMPLGAPDDRGKWPLHELRVHTGAADASWETVCWCYDPFAALGVAADLGVGLAGYPYRFAEVWGANERTAGGRWALDSRVPAPSQHDLPASSG